MDFIAAKKYVEGLNKFGSVLGLDNIFKLLEKLNNPQDKLNVIHVAGTNGKGSTITYMESVLRVANYTTGKYTSPVVFDYLEKFQINGRNISEDDFVDAFVIVKDAYEELLAIGITPTIFEFETAMSFIIFEKKNVDVAIIETGMGGDTDATNVFNRVLLSVITSISMDHMSFLGNTIEEIASHKAGIIVDDCPVVVNALNSDVLKVIKDTAKKKNAKVYEATTAEEWIDKHGNSYLKYSSAYDDNIFEYIETSMKGNYQRENIALAIEAILALNREYSNIFNIRMEDIYSGIKEACIQGRFEMINENPDIYIDGAHNPDAIIKLKDTILKIKTKKNYKYTIFVMGVLADKDYKSESEVIAPLADYIYTVTPNNIRGLDGEILKKTIEKFNSNVEFVSDMESLRDIILGGDDYKDNLVVIFGSLSYLNDIKEKIGQVVY